MTIAKVAGIASASVAVFTAVVTRTIPWLLATVTRRTVSNRIGAELYPPAQLARSIRNYLRPDFQDLDPAGGDEPRMVYGARQPLFGALDDAFSRRTEYRYLILLADSGMGKTSALINYYAYHLRKIRHRFRLVLIPLNIPDVEKRIEAVENKRNTVLLLDALDEDTLAIVDHRERIRLLVEHTRDFYKVLISCRTQFFGKDEEIPTRTGVIVVGSRAAGESAEHQFHKLYLAPFSEHQVDRYIRKLYPPWSPRREKARLLVAKVPSLSARPMLLAHVDELVSAGKTIRYSFELYEEMVNAWIHREDGFINNPAELRRFSESLAVDLYARRVDRGAERIQMDELMQLAKQWDITIDPWNLSGRSLLNRDAEGNLKFAHRSIMEYLYVNRALKGDPQCRVLKWTDQMKDFLREMFLSTDYYWPRHLGWQRHLSDSRPKIKQVLQWLDINPSVFGYENAVLLLRWIFSIPGDVTIDVFKSPGPPSVVDAALSSTYPTISHELHGRIADLYSAAKKKGAGELFGIVLRNAKLMNEHLIFANGQNVWEFKLPATSGDASQTAMVVAYTLIWAENLPFHLHLELDRSRTVHVHLGNSLPP
ncbi:MAG: NACHT domain-containing protein [Longimicrobiaceae bacterium]